MENESAERTILAERGISAPSTNQNSREILYKVELSVRPETNPLYNHLIEEFAKQTSIPMLINTSLNINEQPTVNSPLEALHTYFCSGLDVLYLGPYRLEKPR